MLKKASDREDFPLPVRPQIPTYSSKQTGGGQSGSLRHAGETSDTPAITEWRFRTKCLHAAGCDAKPASANHSTDTRMTAASN